MESPCLRKICLSAKTPMQQHAPRQTRCSFGMLKAYPLQVQQPISKACRALKPQASGAFCKIVFTAAERRLQSGGLSLKGGSHCISNTWPRHFKSAKTRITIGGHLGFHTTWLELPKSSFRVQASLWNRPHLE